MNSIDKILDGLNDKQLSAVKETEGFIRVIAGAGSGKTKALTSRYAYIVEALGINSSNILCVTFTNKAAQEMKIRVKKIVGEYLDLSLITTYHGFCVRVLREDINVLQYPKKFIIMDVEDQKTVIREIFNEFGINSKTFTFKQILKNISYQKTSLEYLEYIIGSRNRKSVSEIDKIFIRYLEKQQRNYALDFDDLINFTLYIFINHKNVLEKWQKNIHYIQVDETQDSSLKQFRLMEMLSEFHNNLFVVGDPDQTIYEWRGAKPEILVDFDKQFSETKTIIMNQNYRSTPNILNLGNHIIKNNKIRVDKDLFTLKNKGVDVVHFHAKNEFEEGLWVANEIKRLVQDESVKYSEIVILYRANYISRIVEQSLIRANLPYSVWGGIRFFERKEIKDTLAYLRLIVFEDDFSFLRVINAPSRGLGRKYIEALAAIAEKDDTSLFEAFESNIEEKFFSRPGAIEFFKLIKRFKQLKNELGISDLVKIILDETGMTAKYRVDGDTDRLDNIKELQNSIIVLENQEEEKISLEEYLQEIALYTDMDIEDDRNDRIKLMTIHTAKGLEFPFVFLCGFTEGVLPSAMSIKERRERALEEERRLTYVAITRAEQGFYMTESEGYNFTTGLNKYPSRFLFEINENLYVRNGVLPQEIIVEAQEQLKNESKNKATKIFKIGDIVFHSIWKKGKVVGMNENKAEYQIQFFDIEKIKPINFSFKGLKLITSTRTSKHVQERRKEIKSNEADVKHIQIPEDIKLKADKIAKDEFPDNLQMQGFAYEKQLKAYCYLQSVTDKELKETIIKQYPDDYEMQEKTYKEIKEKNH